MVDETIKDHLTPGSLKFPCPLCGAQVGWYKGFSGNQDTRVCVHEGEDGNRCPASGKSLRTRVEDLK